MLGGSACSICHAVVPLPPVESQTSFATPGLVLRAWLICEKGMTVDEATSYVDARWPHLGLWNESFTAALHRLSERRCAR